jgi:hypothetical protein
MRPQNHQEATPGGLDQRRRRHKVSHSTVAKTSLDQNFSRLEVKAVGKPKPEGKWLKQGIEIIPSREFLIENFEDGTSILTISEVYPDDTGDIVYEAQNPLGVAVTTTQLLVESTEGKLETNQSDSRQSLVLIMFLINFSKPDPFPNPFIQTKIYCFNLTQLPWCLFL